MMGLPLVGCSFQICCCSPSGEPEFSAAHLDYDQLNKADRTIKARPFPIVKVTPNLVVELGREVSPPKMLKTCIFFREFVNFSNLLKMFCIVSGFPFPLEGSLYRYCRCSCYDLRWNWMLIPWNLDRVSHWPFVVVSFNYLKFIYFIRTKYDISSF